jgi:hypothetical protein
LYRQLPEFGRLTYPVRAEATKHVLPGRKSPGCPAAVCAAVGTIWGARKIGGLNIKKYLPPRNTSSARSRFERITRGKPTQGRRWVRPMTWRKKQVNARCGTAGVWDQASKERFSEITSGCVKKTGNRHAVREMEEGPPRPLCRGRFQTAISCFGPMAAVVNVMVKRRDFDLVM